MFFLLRWVLLVHFISALNILSHGQRRKDQYPTQYFEGNIGIAGSQQNFSINCHFDWNMNAGRAGKVFMIQMGLGARLTSYIGSNQYFVTVPEMISNPQGYTLLRPNVPDPDPANKDSVFVSGSQMQSLNLMFNLSFIFKKWLHVGFNGDLIGGTFGSQHSAVYINGTYAEAVTVTPEHYNCFWIGKGDQSGMMLVEFYVTLQVADRIALKLAFQSLDLEYRTDKQVQTYPKSNDRFRLSPTMASAGIVYSFGKYP